ncbi:MAG TPA: hypothetical protein VFH07_10885 [Chitinophagaceae bacterium]|nr:hypothetical protein [Chitinophagaceae bacterium]
MVILSGVLWKGIQTSKLGDSNKFARLAQQKTIVTGQNRAMDEAIIIAFVDAVIEKKQNIIDQTLRAFFPNAYSEQMNKSDGIKLASGDNIIC